MNNLTPNQLNFLVKFFEPNLYSNIAIKLLTTGKCIVAGTEPIWKGGIGNFIQTSNYVEGVGCLLYTFDLNNFLISKYFRERLEQEIKDLDFKADLLQIESSELKELLK
jgi:hypothetical protein